MEPMFLRDVEEENSTSRFGQMARMMLRSGIPVPQIFYLFAFKPEATDRLCGFTQAAMRGPSPLSAGLRELIAAFTSSQNHCPF